MIPSEDPAKDGSEMPTEEGDENPAFVNMDDVVEVQIQDNDEPMEDVDDNEEEKMNSEEERAEVVEEMAKVVLDSHNDSVYCIASHFDRSSNVLYNISGGGDDKAFLHKVTKTESTTTETIPLSYKHTDSVSCAALNLPFVSADLNKTPIYAAVGAYDGTIIIYDPISGTKLKDLEGPNDIEFVSFHPKGGSVLLAGSSDDGTVWMYHLPTSKCMQVFVGHESGVTAGTFTPDGKSVLSCGSDGTLRVWAPRTGVGKFVFRLGTKGAGLTCMATNDNPDSHLVLVGAEDGIAHICHIASKKVIASLQHAAEENSENQKEGDEGMENPSRSVETVGFAPSALNLNWCATGGIDGNLKIWDLNSNGACRHTCRHGSGNGVTNLQWHPVHPIVFTGATDGTIRIWDARNGTLIKALTGHTALINDLTVDATEGGGAIIVSASDDNSVRVFEINSENIFANP